MVGRRAEPTSQFAQQWGFEQHGLDLDEAVQDPQVDAVVVTSPNELHVSQATTALEAGKHLLLEIPIAMNLADAQQVTNLSRQLNRRLMICHTLRFQPGLVEIRRRVEAEQFHLHHFFAMFGILRRENTNMYGKPRSWTDNILWHHGAHLVDLAIWISGCDQPTNVDCRFGPLHPRQGVMDMSLTMSLDGGVPATICQSYNIHTFHWRATFIGEEDTLYWNEGELRPARSSFPEQIIRTCQCKIVSSLQPFGKIVTRRLQAKLSCPAWPYSNRHKPEQMQQDNAPPPITVFCSTPRIADCDRKDYRTVNISECPLNHSGLVTPFSATAVEFLGKKEKT